MSNNQVALTIIEQLEQSFDMTINGLKISILDYIGAKKPLVYYDNGVMFEVPKRKKIIIDLTHQDLYDVSLYSLKSMQILKTRYNIDCSQLKDVIFNLLEVS